MALVVTTPPTDEPVSLDEAKAHLGFYTDERDSYIDAIRVGARVHCEMLCSRAFVPTGFTYTLSRFPVSKCIEMPVAQLQVIESVEYTDENGNPIELPADMYQVDLLQTPGRIVLQPNASWPNTKTGIVNAVQIKFTAGYPAGKIPGNVIQAIMVSMTQDAQAGELELGSELKRPREWITLPEVHKLLGAEMWREYA